MEVLDLGYLGGGERGHHARIDAARQQRPDRDVAAELEPGRVAHEVDQMPALLLGVGRAIGRRAGPPIGVYPDSPVRIDREAMPGRQLVYPYI